MTKPFIENPPYRPASAALAFTRENFAQWLYLARRSSAPLARGRDVHPAFGARTDRARTRTAAEG